MIYMKTMIDLNDVDTTLARTTSAQLPTTRAEARARLIEVEDAIAAIRTQLGAAELRRQASRTPIDPDWFHRAKTALRHLERERAELRARIAALPGPRDRLKDCIIAVVREDYDDEGWSRVLRMASVRDRH
jgi:hypothetical protein